METNRCCAACCDDEAVVGEELCDAHLTLVTAFARWVENGDAVMSFDRCRAIWWENIHGARLGRTIL